MHDSAFESEPCRQNGDEYICINREEQHLEDRIEGDQPGSVFRIPAGKIIPHYDHCDAACKPYHDESYHVFRIILKKDDCQQKHQYRADNPVLNEGKPKDLSILEHFSEFLIFHLCQWRIHHEN